MKKLLMTMAASVAAIGLTYAEGEITEGAEGEATVQPTSLVEFTNTFNIGEDGDQTLGEQFNPDAEYEGAVIWQTDDKEGIVVTNATELSEDCHLKLETAKGAPLLRTFANYGTPPQEEGAADERTVTPIENQDVIVDAMISFTGFEEAPVPTEGEDKILVWMKAVDAEFDDEGKLVPGTGVTNLMITAGQIIDLETNRFEPFSTNVLENAEVNKEYRITIKSVGNIVTEEVTGGRLGFEVYIDRNLVSVPAQYWESRVEDYVNSGINITKVFPSLIAGTSLKAAGFEGTGTIDEVLVCAADSEDAPSFTQGGGEPGSDVTRNDPEVEFEGNVETVNGKLAAYLKNPFGDDANVLFDAYVGMFEAVLGAETGKVKIQLKQTAIEALKEEVNNLSTNATEGIARILTELASATGDVVQLTNIAVTPGLWYSVAAGSELDGMDEGRRTLAESATMTLDVPVVKDQQGKKSTKAFYKVLVNVTDNPPEPVE